MSGPGDTGASSSAVPGVADRRVACIGLGHMGGPMADHVIAAGYDVSVYDVADVAMAPRVAAGARAAGSPADAARGAEVVCVVVFDDAQAAAVVRGTDGVLSVLSPGAVVCLHTTVSPDTIDELAAAAAAGGVVVLDAGISGGTPGAAAGTLLTMVGGGDAAVADVRPVLECYSKEVLHAGPLGAGMALKLARNAAGYVMMAAVHEAMVLAHRSGIELEQLRHVLADTGVLEQSLAPLSLGGPDPLPVEGDQGMRPLLERINDLGEKDLAQALALAHRTGAAVPAITAVRASFHAVMRL